MEFKLKHPLQNWCDLCHKEFELGKYEMINGKVVCDNCNPKKTSWQAFEWYGITRLSAIIFELRKDGYNIESETLKMKNRYGDPVHFAKYVLKGE